jgi:malignant T-cell-amplified sequence
VMCPGLTSPGGRMDDVGTKTAVAIMAEGKQHAMGVGVTAMSSKEIKLKN